MPRRTISTVRASGISTAAMISGTNHLSCRAVNVNTWPICFRRSTNDTFSWGFAIPGSVVVGALPASRPSGALSKEAHGPDIGLHPHVAVPPSREESKSAGKTDREGATTMFPISDPYLPPDLPPQRPAELQPAAAESRLTHGANAGRPRRFGRWPRASARPRPARTPVVP